MSAGRSGGTPFSPRDSTFDRGRRAEAAGLRWLRARGYRILERNFRTHVGEIDAVASEGDTLCFIEIKARTGRSCGSAVAAVSARQRARLARAAALYLQQSAFQGPCRFDVLGMDWDGTEWRFQLVPNAFETA